MSRDIYEAILSIAGNNKNSCVAVDAVVNSVNKSSRTCSVTILGQLASELSKVRLMACSSDGILLIPQKESVVCVIISTFDEPYISSYSELDAIEFLGGELGGMVIANELLKVINEIQSKVNTLGTQVSALTGTPYAPIVETQITQIENKDITHGKV